jgi:hypothetical protein
VALGPQIDSLSSFGLDASGHLYAADIASGDVFRIESDGDPATDPRCAPPPTSPPPTSPPPTSPVPPPQHAPVNTSAPTIAGSPTAGAKLTCTPGNWSAATSFTYEWLRDGTPRAAGETYRPGAADVGHLLSCRVTATNATGSTPALSSAVRVSQAVPGLSALRITPAAFPAATSGPSDRRTRARGGIVSFRLNETATVHFTVQRARRGRKVNGRCRRDGRGDGQASRCTRWSAVSGTFRVTGKRGVTRFTFTGRVGGHRLDPGDYRLVARVRGVTGGVGGAVRARFTIRA